MENSSSFSFNLIQPKTDVDEYVCHVCHLQPHHASYYQAAAFLACSYASARLVTLT